jgi:hypothetical protein
VCLLPEGTTSNGRAVLKLPEGSLAESEFGRKGEDGIVWIKFIRCDSFRLPLPESASGGQRWRLGGIAMRAQ